MLKYARLLVEMPLAGEFPDYIEFANENDVIIRQRIVYEWKPNRCNHCQMFGHTQDECRKKEKVRQEWRQVTHGASGTQQQEDEEGLIGEDGFHTVIISKNGSRAYVHARKASHIVETSTVNSFNTLLDAEGEEEIRGFGGPGPNG